VFTKMGWKSGLECGILSQKECMHKV